MSSKPSGLRFSSVSSQTNQPQSIKTAANFAKNSTISIVGKKPSTIVYTKAIKSNPSQTMQQTKKLTANQSPYGSDTDISTSNENLSVEQRYVLRHTPRVEPQGQEMVDQNSARYITDQQRFPPNSSNDSTRYASSSRSHSGSQTPILNGQQQSNAGGSGTMAAGNGNGNENIVNNPNNSISIGIGSNRNSYNINSNRSSMDVSTCSYNTLIIHPDDTLHAPLNRLAQSTGDHLADVPNKKDRPHSYGEQGMQEITEIPDDYLNQSHVLKHLAKEMKIPSNRQRTSSRERSLIDSDKENTPKWVMVSEPSNSKVKSKSQPDLTKLPENDIDAMEALVKENHLLKQQLQNCFSKVAKTQKLEEEVTNIYRAHEELKQTCERREKLERAARMRLQSDLQRVQELNAVMKDQVDILQSQLLAPSEHQIMIAQLFTQNKELSAAKERQDIELGAQRATLQEQRNHIGILDSALTNAQQNIRRLEEELRKKQMHIDRFNQLHGAMQQSKQCERKNMLEFDQELAKESNRSGSSTNSETKWQMAEKAHQIRVESEQRHIEDRANASQLSTMDKQDDRHLAEARQDKLRYLEEVHSAQRKMNDLQAHLKLLETKLADKDVEIRLLQEKKICGSSFDSYNSYGLGPLAFNQQTSYNVSNNSFNTTTNTSSLLEQAFSHPSASMASSYVPSPGYSPQVSSPYKSSNPANLQSMNLSGNVVSSGSAGGGGSVGAGVTGGNYSANSSNYSNNYDSPNYNQNTSSYDTSYENITRKSIDDQMKKHLDEQQLLTKRGLCCFPSLTSKKSNLALLSDQVSVLSTNNSDSFLQKLAQIDQRERNRHEQTDQDLAPTATPMSIQTKADEIILLEKQGLCSQKLRNNLAQVTHTIGQNMTDISNIDNNTLIKDVKSYTNLGQSSAYQMSGRFKADNRGTSLPPSALPRPARSLKPPRKIYDRLSDSSNKARSQTPPKLSQSSMPFEMKAATMKRNDYYRTSPAKNYVEMKEMLNFPNPHFSLKRKDYGSMMNKSEFSKPEHTSTKYYQRLEESPKMNKSSSNGNNSGGGGSGGGGGNGNGGGGSSGGGNGFKRSLLPSARKYSPANACNPSKQHSRDSLNSSESNHSVNSNLRQSPIHHLDVHSASNASFHHQHINSRTPPKYMSLAPPQDKTASLPPKPTVVDNRNGRNSGRGNSVTRGENRYKIQF